MSWHQQQPQQLPFHSTLLVRTSPDGRAEYRLEHPGSPRAPAAHPRPALKPSRIGRRVHFAAQHGEEGDEEGGEEESQQEQPHSPYRRTPYRTNKDQCTPLPSAGQGPPPYPGTLSYPGPEVGSPGHSFLRGAPPSYDSPYGSPYPSQPYHPAAAAAVSYAHSPFQPPFLTAAAGYQQQQEQQPRQQAWLPVPSSAPPPEYAWQPVSTAAGQFVAPLPKLSSQFSPRPGAEQPRPQPSGPQLDEEQQQVARRVSPASQGNGWVEQQAAQRAQAGAQLRQQGEAPQRQGTERQLESAQLQVQANTVSITITGGAVEQRGPGVQYTSAAERQPATGPSMQRSLAPAVAIASLQLPSQPAKKAAAASAPSLLPAPAQSSPAVLPEAPPAEQVPVSSCQAQALEIAAAAPAGVAEQPLCLPSAQEEAQPTHAPAVHGPLQLPPAGPSASPVAQPALHEQQPLQQQAAPLVCPQQQQQQQQQQPRQQQQPPPAGSRAQPPPLPSLPHGQPRSSKAALERRPSDAAYPSCNDSEGGGDLSYWGKTHMEDSYYEDGATTGSLSSGLSPRESRPRAKEWDHLEALKALADGTDAYAKAARLQRSGCGGHVSAADSLPARLAAQQLGSLAGMSRKVQEALQHSQRAFERQAQLVEQAVVQRAFYAWKNLHDGKALLRRRQGQIQRRMQWSLLQRCVREWRLLAGQQEQQKLAVRKAQSILCRRLLGRCFKAWAHQCSERKWKVAAALKDKQLQLLAGEVRRMETRPVRYMQRFRSRRWLLAWRDFAEFQQGKQRAWKAAVAQARRLSAAKALGGWQEIFCWRAARQRAQQQAARLLQHTRLQHCLSAWRQLVGHQAGKEAAQSAAEAHHRRQMQRRAVGGWLYLAWFYRTARDAKRGKQLQIQAVALQAWRQQVSLTRVRRALLAEVAATRDAKLLGRALLCWRGYVEGRQARALKEECGRLSEERGRLQAENAELKQDNERLARVIDSGEWERQRVEELMQAGEVLRKERNALLELVQQLQQQQQRPQQQGWERPQQEDDGCSHLRITTEGISAGAALSPCNSPPVSPSARNKLLVKSGSSFNAMVRALKQDLIASGTLSRNPAAVYEVDQLSLNKVSVKPGGELEVEALASPNLKGVAFGRSQAAAGAANNKRPETAGKQGDLLQAALRLQSMGGRSVALGKRF